MAAGEELIIDCDPNIKAFLGFIAGTTATTTTTSNAIYQIGGLRQGGGGRGGRHFIVTT